MKGFLSYFTIKPYIGHARQSGTWTLYFECGYCVHDCESFKAAWKAGQTHIRRDHKGDKVRHVYARQRPPITMYLDRDGRELSRFP